MFSLSSWRVYSARRQPKYLLLIYRGAALEQRRWRPQKGGGRCGCCCCETFIKYRTFSVQDYIQWYMSVRLVIHAWRIRCSRKTSEGRTGEERWCVNESWAGSFSRFRKTARIHLYASYLHIIIKYWLTVILLIVIYKYPYKNTVTGNNQHTLNFFRLWYCLTFGFPYNQTLYIRL